MGEWGMLSHPQNKDSLPWTLGPGPRVTTEGETPFVTSCPGRQHPSGRHACESEHPVNNQFRFFRGVDTPLK